MRKSFTTDVPILFQLDMVLRVKSGEEEERMRKKEHADNY